ncbi:MAG: acyl-CoA dehydrogenase family protein, partial [Dehalococcoidia bacterium]
MLDYYQISELFSPEERQVQTTARKFLDDQVLPHVSQWWEEETLPRNLATQLGELGFLGANLPTEYGTAGVSNVAYGLIM